MSFLNSLNIAGSALTAQRFRMDIIAQNVAHMQTTRAKGTAEEPRPYARKQVVFEERGLNFKDALKKEDYKLTGGVRVAEVVESDTPFNPVYDPTHPDANEDGYVMYPNVNTAEEQSDFMVASRAYEANITSLNIIKTMAMKALEIGK